MSSPDIFTGEEQLILKFTKMETSECLKSLGVEPTESDMKLIASLKEYLKPPVVNILLTYVVTKTEMNLTPSYAKKIGVHWARKKIDTATKAIEIVKSEHQLYLQWASPQKNNWKYVKLFTSNETYDKFTKIVLLNGFNTDEQAFKYIVDKAHEEMVREDSYGKDED